MADMFKEAGSFFEKQLREAFKPVVDNQQSDLFRVIALVFYHNEKLSDIYDIYKLLGIEDFIRLIHLLDGKTVKLPTSTELKESILLALCFYYKEIENLSWPEVHDRISFNFSSLNMAYKIKSLSSALKAELKNIFSHGGDGVEDEGK
jgi:hypothetical protein